MLEHLFEYIAIIVLLVASLYVMRHQIKGYFKSPSLPTTQATFRIKVKDGYLSLSKSSLSLLWYNKFKREIYPFLTLIPRVR